MQTYDRMKHTVGIGLDNAHLKGVVCPYGGWRKRVQDTDNRRIQIGETRWLQDAKVSEWSQADFSGGAYQDILTDPAMFNVCTAFLPSKRNPRSARSTQTLVRAVNQSGAAISSATYPALAAPKASFVSWGQLWILGSNDYMYCLTPTTTEGRFTVTVIADSAQGAYAQCFAPNTNIGTVVVGYSDGTAREFNRVKTVPIAAAPTGTDGDLFRAWAVPVSLPTRFRTVKAVKQYNGKMVIAYRNRVYYMDASNSDVTAVGGWNTGCPMTFLGDCSEEEVVSINEYRNALYFLARTGSFNTSIDTSTLVAGVLPWMAIPYAFQGQCLQTYAGRMYLGGFGADADGTEVYAQVFELSGNEMRELRVFYDMVSQYGGGSAMSNCPTMCVYEGMLFMPNKERGALEAYDFPTDSFWTAYPIQAALAAGTGPSRVHALGATIVTTCVGTNAGVYYIPRANSHDVAPVLETSEFAVEPAKLKRWLECRVHSRYARSTVQVSGDGGLTWSVSLVAATTSEVGYNFACTFDLTDITPSASIKVRVSLGTADEWVSTSYYWREIDEVVVSFMVEPATLRLYDMTVVLADRLELLDGSVDTTSDPDTDVVIFWGWYDSQTPLVLHDRDGRERLVMLTKIQEDEPEAPGSSASNVNPNREVYMTITLAETTSA